MAYNPTRSRDHEDRGVRRFIEALREKPFLDALTKSYLKQIQYLEDASWEVWNQWQDVDLSGLSGVALDWAGKLLRRGRNGLSDADYRIALRTQVLINRSSGLAREILVIARRSIPTGYHFLYQEHYPAGFLVTVLEVLTAAQARVVTDNLAQSKAAGVAASVVWSETGTDPDRYFAWASEEYTNSEEEDSDRGWGSTTEPTLGGQLTTVKDLRA